jgi:hypothetical protein
MHYDLYIPGNVYDLTNRLPSERNGDRFGMVLYFNPKVGWTCEPWSDAAYFQSEGYISWTHTPTMPEILIHSPMQSDISNQNLIEG